MSTELAHRLALLELCADGRLRRRQGQAGAWDELLALGWMRRTSRRGEADLDEAARNCLEAALDACWPEWRDALAKLRAEGLSIDERGWKELRRLERAREVAPSPPRLNRRTATGQVADHSKATLTAAHLETLGAPQIVGDGLVRMRVPSGMRLLRGETVLDCSALMAMLGEVMLSERAMLDGTRLVGPVRAVLSVENRGPYMDLPVPDGWLVVHAPGWDTIGVRLLMEQMGEIPWLHFGDLDPQGVAIVRHLRETRRDLGWLLPAWWPDVAPRLHRDWPDDLVGGDDPPLVTALAAQGTWLEQEPLTLDPRLAADMELFLTQWFEARERVS